MNRTAILSVILVGLVAVLAGAVFALPQAEGIRESLLGPGLDNFKSSSTAVAAVTPETDDSAAGGMDSFAAPLSGSTDPLQAPSLSGGDEKKEEGAAEEAKEGEAKEGEEAKAEEKKPQTDEEWIAKLDEWKTQDPRAIIESKYEDLEGRKTTPWNEDDPANFIPETGRADPLSPVLSQLPDELKQRRGGETDPNEIYAYAFAAAATQAVDSVMAVLQVYNVVQIGTQKLITMGIPGDRAFTVPEGGSFGFNFPGAGFAVQVQVQVLSVSTEEVMVGITGSVPGTDASISKTQVYIPRSY
ncbi:hypothetical protein IT575_03310 [bacterium]|nr:hypothetical protein [bacterium]